MMTSPQRQIASTLLAVAIYNQLARSRPEVETGYEDTDDDRIKIMPDCAPLVLDCIETYPFKYHYLEDRGWLEKVSYRIARWFWKEHGINESAEFFVCKVEIEENHTITFRWGSR